MAQQQHHHGFFSHIFGGDKSEDKKHDEELPPCPPINPHDPPPRPADISARRSVLHGPDDWSDLIDPLDADLRSEILKYGDFTEATYDSFDGNGWSKYCGTNLYGIHHLLKKLGLDHHGYKASAYIYAMCHVNLPRWLEKSWHADKWDQAGHSNWIGYVAVSGERETARIGYRDILVVWRGTLAAEEWLKDFETKLAPALEDDGRNDDGAEVEKGFHSIYTANNEESAYSKLSAKEQVLDELSRLIPYFQGNGEEVCITIAGHSLGGALALLSAADIALAYPEIQVSVFTFGGPRTGNKQFCDRLTARRVKILRMVNTRDLVHKLPGIVIDVSKEIKELEVLTGPLHFVYEHTGHELEVNPYKSPYLKTKFDALGFHNLEMYLHLVDGHHTKDGPHREDGRRDPTLVNKTSAMLRDETLIPATWFGPPNKGLVRNRYGRWQLPQRDNEDLPAGPDVKTPLEELD